MFYIIDGNNLAGRLGIIKEKDFDQKIIALMRNFIGNKNIEVTLVFDGAEYMGDRWREGNLTVIYSPKDNSNRNADDIIIELIKEQINKNKATPYARQQIKLVTNDSGIRTIVSEVDASILFEDVDLFAEKLLEQFNQEDRDDTNDNQRNLSDEQVKRINEELLKLWK
jgi:microsomal dipeptidase-like Zn-dependent dipeptidase